MTLETWTLGKSTHRKSADGLILWNSATNIGSSQSTGGKTAGKWYVEYQPVGVLDTNSVIGLATAALSVDQFSGQLGDSNSLGWDSGGNFFAGSNSGTTFGGWLAGDIICLAIDRDSGKIWARKNNNAWHNSGDPVAGTNQTATMAAAETHLAAMPYVAGSETARAFKILSSATNQVYTPPAGYTPWADGEPGPVRAVCAQPYSIIGNVITAVTAQPYALTQRAVAVLIQLYGMRLRAVLAQWYGDVAAVRRRLDQWYGSAAVLRRRLDQGYGDALALRQLVAQDWTMPADLRAVLAQLFSVAGERLQGLAEQRYSLQEYAALRARLDQLWILPPGEALVQRPVITVTADGLAIDPHHITIDIDEADYAVRGEIHLADQAHFLLCRHMVTELLITIDGDVYRVVVDSPRRSRPEAGRTEYYVPFVSPTVRLDGPYAAPISREFAGAMASAIAAEMAALGGITIAWQLVDWYLPAATLYANNETPLAVIRKLVEAVGGLLQTTPAGVLVCRPAYPLAVTAWATAVPAFYLTDMDNFFSVDSTPQIRAGYNRYAVSNQAAATAGLTLEQKDINATTKEILVYQVPWDEAAVIRLRTSGGAWVSIVSGGVVTVELTELVEIVGGEGHTAKPIAALGAHVYKQAVLGAITAAEDGQISTEVGANSLLEVTYTTRYRKFLCSDALIEDVQFYPEEVEA